ncbi:MAG: zf-HC2 domain-containing protein [Acidobacteria bacterium]|nr:zf-HC2 domain-containing protein [Acidobacteriota bacterium]
MRGCRKIRSRLGRLLDQELTGREAAAVHSHVAECPDCSNALALLLALNERLDALLPPPPPAILEGVMTRARRENSGRRAHIGWPAPWHSWPLAVRFAASAAAIAACVIGLMAGSTAARYTGRLPDRDTAIMIMDAGPSLLAAYIGERR